MTTVDRDGVLAAYEDVRNDSSETTWATFTYDANEIKHSKSGTAYQEFLGDLADDVRLFGFVRMTTGDELSKRAKFALITWIGEKVSPIAKAKMSMDKMMVKDIVKNVAIELQSDDLEDLTEDAVMDAIRKAGGANYGTGVQD